MIVKKYIPVLTVLAVLWSCDKEPLEQPEQEPVQTDTLVTVPYPQTPDAPGSFYALIEEGPDSLAWEAGDTVALWNGTAYSLYVAAAGGRETILTGEDADVSGNYHAVWPADTTAVFGEGTLSFTMPSHQTLVEGDFPYAPAVAFSTGADRDFRFRSLCGMLGFTVTRDDIMKITFMGKRCEAVAGTVVADISDMSAPALRVNADAAVGEIVLTAENGSAIKPGTYFMAMVPQTFSEGIILSIFNSAGEQAERVRSQSITIGRGEYLYAGNIDALEEWGTKYHISSLEEFLSFMRKETHDASEDIELLTDIDLSGLDVGSIGKFDGRFEGNGHRITNWKMKAPFIGTLNGSLYNLVIDQTCSAPSVPANEDFAAIVRTNNGLVSGCKNYMDIYCEGVEFNEAHSVAGVVAVTSGRVEECVNYGDVFLRPTNVEGYTSNEAEGSKVCVGGVVGKVNCVSDPVEIVLCENHGDITYFTDGYIKSQSFVGGVAGGSLATICSSFESWTPYGNTLLRCTNTGDVRFGYRTPVTVSGINTNCAHVGGVAGYWEGTVTTARNSGTVDVLGARDTNLGGEFLRGLTIGGIVGVVSGTISDAVNDGKIVYSGTTAGAPNTTVASGQTGSIAIAGVAGLAGNGLTTSISDCHNNGVMDIDMHMKSANGTAGAVGGVAAYSYSAMEKCSNTGDIDLEAYKKTIYFGGVVGYSSLFTITSCTNSGSLSLDLAEASGNNHGYRAYLGGIAGHAGKYIYYSDNSGDLSLKGGYGNTSSYYYVGGILGEAEGGVWHYGTKDRYMENTGNIHVDTPGNVRVGGIEGTGSGGRLWYTRNLGTIDVKAGRDAVYVGGLRGYCTGQIQFSECMSDITLTTSSPTSHVSGATAYMGATQIKNMTYLGDITCNYTGDRADPTIYASLAVARLSCYCTFTGSYGGNVTVNGVEPGAKNLWCHALMGLADTGVNEDDGVITLGEAGATLGIKAGSVINGVEVTVDNYDDKTFLLGGEWTVNYKYSETNAITLE